MKTPRRHTRAKKPLTRISARDSVIALALIAGNHRRSGSAGSTVEQRGDRRGTDIRKPSLRRGPSGSRLPSARCGRVPIQTPEDALATALSREGFREASPRRMVFRRWVVRSSLTCGFDASVAWEADNAGRVVALEAHYLRALGCVEQK